MIFNCHDCIISLQSCNNIYSHPNTVQYFLDTKENFPKHPLDHSPTYTKTSATLHSVYFLLCLKQSQNSPSGAYYSTQNQPESNHRNQLNEHKACVNGICSSRILQHHPIEPKPIVINGFILK